MCCRPTAARARQRSRALTWRWCWPCGSCNKPEAIAEIPVNSSVAAVSVGLVNDAPLLDLCYDEDSKAAVDMNVVMTGTGQIVEVQGTGEDKPFSKDDLGRLLKLAESGIKKLLAAQRRVLR